VSFGAPASNVVVSSPTVDDGKMNSLEGEKEKGTIIY